MIEPWGLHWFRRDLRVTGNQALSWNWKQSQGRVLGFFCFDPKFLSRPDFSADRFGFFLKSLQALRAELRDAGGDLLVLDEGPQKAFPKLFEHLKNNSKTLPSSVSWNRDYEPFARERDQWAEHYFKKNTSIEVHTQRDHLLIEPHEIVNESSKERDYYSVYSPFSRRWFEAMGRPEIRGRVNIQKEALKQLKKRSTQQNATPLFRLTWPELYEKKQTPPDSLDTYAEKVLKKVIIPLPEAGHATALKTVEIFKKRIQAYKENRDYPDLPGTSRLSIYLKNGSITSSQILASMSLENEQFKFKSGPAHFVKELAWREFYYHILWHCPEVEHQSFLPAFRDLKWENDKTLFQAWKDGLTGYPIVDAGMRELSTTGWMHNRVRMIVASFLTKDLLIDWRWGERYFMERLLDGDLAPNNGGWQWAASTGCDPQPYFRIFNPELQSRKFDPQGNYIRRFVPELKHLDGNSIHAPTPLDLLGKYPAPVVEHSERRLKAITLYKLQSDRAKK